MKTFIKFIFVSGVGWMIDLISFSLLVKLAIIPLTYINFTSSMLGVSYVWFISLGSIFKYKGRIISQYLIYYWLYQLLSISLYSIIIHTVNLFVVENVTDTINYYISNELLSKIIVTVPNLVTNFLFMKFLIHIMSSKVQCGD